MHYKYTEPNFINTLIMLESVNNEVTGMELLNETVKENELS